MRSLLAIGAMSAALLAAGAAAAQTPNLAGTWHISGRILHGNAYATATPVCVFVQRGAQLGGSCRGPHASGPVEGVVSGNSVTWSWSNRATNAGGVTGVTGFNGTLINSRLIRGTMTSTALGGRGTFTQTR